MADESTQSIVVDAPPERIMAVIADFPAYPEWAQAFTKVDVLSLDARERAEQVAFALESGPFKDSYTLAYTWADDGLRVDWTLVKGQMQRAQRGSYVLTSDAGGTTVTYTLSVQLAVPMIGLFRRKAEKMIMDTALKELKRRVERG
ncbi:SRPBCC family protein [Actinokineospora enzanensis]|uniref:SRPBCC family protein n=1 Tax=Actinokineospora enzanensis TaxID=155975 RepID=UPI00037D83E0|nr:SRPBCC family protein [Actinokineospora enzanensis]